MASDRDVVVSRALEWLQAHVAEVIPGQHELISEASLTALAEFALFTALLERKSLQSAARKQINDIRRHAQQSFGLEDVVGFYFRAPDAAAIGLIITWLGLRGFGSDRILRFDELEEFVGNRVLQRLHSNALSALELRWALDHLGISHSLPSKEELFFRCMPCGQSESEAYRLTHAVFFVTDFGDQPIGPNCSCAPTELLLMSLLKWAMGLYQFDLVAELVLTANYLGYDFPALYDCWQWLLANQHADGTFYRFTEEDLSPRRLYHRCLTAVLAGHDSVLGRLI